MDNASRGRLRPHTSGAANIASEPKPIATTRARDEDLGGDAPASWVAAARTGSQTAYAALYRHYLPLVHGLLLARHRPAVADELTQDCFAQAFQRLDQLRDTDAFGPWIAAIARHLRAPGHLELPLESAPEPGDASAGPEQHSETMTILRAVQGLPLAYRETLLLRLVEGMSGPEIAAQTGLGADSVRVNLHRGLRLLRQRLDLSAQGTPLAVDASEAGHE